MDYCIEYRRYENGLIYGTLILRLDRARERTHRRLMRLYHLGGNRTEALRQYERCKTALHEELGVAPSQRTKELLKQIRMDQLEKFASAEVTKIHPTQMHAMPLRDILGRLKQLAGIQAELQKKHKKKFRFWSRF